MNTYRSKNTKKSFSNYLNSCINIIITWTDLWNIRTF